eukprot:9214954-Alexandrium_andersonii.AAC.1
MFRLLLSTFGHLASSLMYDALAHWLLGRRRCPEVCHRRTPMSWVISKGHYHRGSACISKPPTELCDLT